jgi:NADH-quinone oxidoreductase subunit K
MSQVHLFMGALIFGFGLLGFLTRRNLILMFLSLELMLLGVSLNFITFGNQHQDLGGQTFVILILAVAACEAAIALSLIVTLYRSRGSLDVNLWQALGANQGKQIDKKPDGNTATNESQSTSDDTEEDHPKLTPAGQDPLEHPTSVDAEFHEPAELA